MPDARLLVHGHLHGLVHDVQDGEGGLAAGRAFLFIEGQDPATGTDPAGRGHAAADEKRQGLTGVEAAKRVAQPRDGQAALFELGGE